MVLPFEEICFSSNERHISPMLLKGVPESKTAMGGQKTSKNIENILFKKSYKILYIFPCGGPYISPVSPGVSGGRTPHP